MQRETLIGEVNVRSRDELRRGPRQLGGTLRDRKLDKRKEEKVKGKGRCSDRPTALIRSPDPSRLTGRRGNVRLRIGKGLEEKKSRPAVRG